MILTAICGTPSAAGGQTADGDWYRQLQAPLKMAASGQSLRQTLQSLQRASGQPFWLERRVDPDQPVDVPLAGPTVASAFEQVAASVGLATLPIDGMIVVGRADWLDRVGAVLMQDPSAAAATDGPSATEITWPMLSSPIEALRIAAEPPGWTTDQVTLPHDLWPAARFPPQARASVIQLIGAEFDVCFEIDPLRRQLRAVPLPEETAVLRTYPAGRLTPIVRQAVAQRHPQARWTPAGDSVQLRAAPRAHAWLSQQLAVAGALTTTPRRADPAPGAVGERFTLRLENAAAGRVLATLAAHGNWTLQIDPAAVDRCDALVSLEAKDATLIDLVKQVAQQVGLQADAQGAVLHIRAGE